MSIAATSLQAYDQLRVTSNPSLTIKEKKRKCAICRTEFRTFSSLVKWCSPEHGAEVAMRALEKKRAREAKEVRQADRARREKLKTRSDWMKEAQSAFNAWVKERDFDLPCVSCGRHHNGAYHAGHYLSVGARPDLRFEPLNVWKQCAPCNLYLSGNLVLYRQELVRRIGLAKVEWLEGPHESKKLTVEDLREIVKTYRARAREMKRSRNA